MRFHPSKTLSLLFSLGAIRDVVATGPTVRLDSGTFTGTLAGTTHRFLGIPFAKPPVGDLRFRLPQTIPAYDGLHDVTNYGPNCVQPGTNTLSILDIARSVAAGLINAVFGPVFRGDSEDCLTLNVIRPSTATASSNLPVLVWIYGGAFQSGEASFGIQARSVTIGNPVIYVSINYRLNAFGFLGGSQVKAAGVGNLGLQDQREALRWVQKYIGQFGGDPNKVTLWGQSAGAMSVSFQMLTNGGNPQGLFRAAFMQSGAPIPLSDITNSQVSYDAVVSEARCGREADTFACLRSFPYATLKTAINTVAAASSLSLGSTFAPGVDGVFLTDNPQHLVQQGKVANIPFITGNCDDEGTAFSTGTTSIVTEAQFRQFIKAIHPSLSDSQVDQIQLLYPSDITLCSPFDTGIFNALTPQYKRISAVQGDALFQAPRRWFLDNMAATNPNVWVSEHTSDLANSYGGGEMQDQLIRFVTFLDPNSPNPLDFQWPRYNLQSRQLLTYLDGLVPLIVIPDTYRRNATDYLTSLTLANPGSV